MAYIIGNTATWEYVIGLEVHAQVQSNSKLFSGSSTEFGASPNTQVDLFDAAMPGMLPVLNEFCLQQAIKTGLALNARVNHYSVFDRKNYFYPDLPSGYQITQFYHPIVQEGYITIRIEDETLKKIRINRLHLEQDAGKSIHDQSPTSTYIDLNRAGIALMEIVTEPEISSPYEAAEYLKKLRAILRCIGSCDGDMEKGSLRCDANVSVRKKGESLLGTRCEIKNLNSTKNIIKAIEFEAARQVEVLEQGGIVLQETKLFDPLTGQTRTMRLKGEADDYRYFPDPDLLPVLITQDLITEFKNRLPELPDAKILRYQQQFELSSYDAEVLAADEAVAKYFEEAASIASPKIVANWILTELFGLLNKNSMQLNECSISPNMLGNMVKLINDGIISGKIAKEVFQLMFETGETSEQIVKQKGLVQLSDKGALKEIVEKILRENENSVTEYKNGKDKLFGFFVGQVMKQTNGRASPTIVNELLKESLNK